jgi:O-antigen ligase
MVLTATLALALLSEVPWIAQSVRTLILRLLVTSFFAVLFAIDPIASRARSLLREGALPWLLLVLLWCVVNTVWPPTNSLKFGGIMRPVAILEDLRIALCVGAFVTAGYGLRAVDIKPMALIVLAMTVAFSFYGLANAGTAGADHALISVFGNHEQAGSFIMLFLPVAMAVAIDGNNGVRVGLPFQSGTVVLACTLILSRARSAWIGEIFGLLTFFTIWFRCSPIRLSGLNRTKFIGPALIMSMCLVVFALFGEMHPLLMARISTFANGVQDASLAERIHRWTSACRMLAERPLTGWGPGAFPVLQKVWTGSGDAPDEVLRHGTGHSNLAHNFYVQWGAETGIVGLTLYVAALVAFFLNTVRLTPKLQPGINRSLAIGSLASAVSAWGDMIGSPSYSYPAESILSWMIMGLGIAACRAGWKGEDSGRTVLPRTPHWILVASLASGLLVSVIVFDVGKRHPMSQRAPAQPSSIRPHAAGR